MNRVKTVLTILLLMLAVNSATARFLQEVELKDGSVLVGHVYRQRPGKFIVFHATQTKKDPQTKYKDAECDYTLQWKDVKTIRRAPNADPSWCNDKVTLKDGTVYIGQIDEQQLGVQLKLRQNDTEKVVTLSYTKIRTVEKTVKSLDSDMWQNRQYTDRVLMTDDTLHEGLVVMRYFGDTLNDCYVELMHASGNRQRIYLPDIAEYQTYLN